MSTIDKPKSYRNDDKYLAVKCVFVPGTHGRDWRSRVMVNPAWGAKSDDGHDDDNCKPEAHKFGGRVVLVYSCCGDDHCYYNHIGYCGWSEDCGDAFSLHTISVGGQDDRPSICPLTDFDLEDGPC